MSASTNPDTFELNLTPLLDVVLQLIMFFMVCVKFTVGNPNVFAAETDNVRLVQAKNDKGKFVVNIFAVREIKGYDRQGQPIRELVTEVPSEDGGPPFVVGQITVILFPDNHHPEVVLVEGASSPVTPSVRRDIVNYLRRRDLIEPHPPEGRKPTVVTHDAIAARVAAEEVIEEVARQLRIEAGRAASDRSIELSALAVLRVDREATFGMVQVLTSRFDLERMKTEVRVVTAAR